MRCTACGHENRETARFCGACAAPLLRELACSACGASNPPGQRFCDACAHPLAHRDTPGREPRSYTPNHLAEKILTTRSALEGERKQVTVLFADVKSSLDLAEQVDPEEWHRILDRFFTILADGVHRFEGTVNQYTGDGVMALFGAPIAHEDHAQRACWAALHLREALRAYADELRVERGLSFAVRMGLNSGEVVVGKIGDDLRMDYTAQGHTVGLAARMEQLAEPGKVLLTEHTAGLVGGYFALRDLGAARLKGVTTPLHVFELEGPGALRTRLDVSRARGFSRFVGRAAEMAALETALERAVAGQGQVVGVVADAGIGKSRLCHEFAQRCRARGLLVREAHGVSHGQMLPFLPVLEFLRAVFEIEERETPRAARHKVAGALLLLDRELEPALPLLFDFLAIPDPERPSPPLPPEERQRQLLGIISRVIEARSARQPAVTLIEDLHWIDQGTEAFLATLAEVVGRTRTLLLVNFRPGYRAAWLQRSYYQQLPLLPLGPDAIAELLEDLLGTHASLEGLAARIQERTAGNPFFIEESVLALAETGHLAGTRGAYRLAVPVERLVLPATVQAVLAARIDRLPEREKEVLQAAAVIGKEFPESVLQDVSGVPAPELDEALRNLVAAEFAYEQTLYPEREYAFKHPLTQEVAYSSQLAERRARVHAAVARALETRYRDGLDGHAGELAHHWEQAGDVRNAVAWHRRAAELAGAPSAVQSMQHWRKVRELSARLPPSAEVDELGATARVQLLIMAGRAGVAPAEMGEFFREGIELVARSGNELARARLITAYGFYRLFTEGAVHDELVADLEGAVRRVDQSPDVAFQVTARNHLIFALQQRDVRRLVTVADEALARLVTDPERGAVEMGVPPWPAMTFSKVIGFLWLGRLREAAVLVEALAEFAREHSNPFCHLFQHWGKTQLALGMGDGPGALGHAQQAVAIAERQESLFARTVTYFFLGVTLNESGEWERAERIFGNLLAHARDQAVVRIYEAPFLTALADARLGRGDAEGARARAEEAVELAHRRGSLFAEAGASLALARALVSDGSSRATLAAEAALARVEALVERSGHRFLLAPVARVRAARARVLGDESARAAHLREALRLYTEMGADGHAARVARELG